MNELEAKNCPTKLGDANDSGHDCMYDIPYRVSFMQCTVTKYSVTECIY